MNICFPSLTYPVNGYASSGVGSQVRLLAHGLIDAGHTISVVDLAEKRERDTTDEHGAEVLHMRSGKLHWYAGKLPLIGKALTLPLRELEYSLAVWRGVRRAHKTRALDLIEGTETGMLLVALFGRRVPLIIRLHGEQYTFHKYTPGLQLSAAVRLSRALQRVALRRAKLLISPSYAHAHEIQEELGLAHPPIVVVPNSVNIGKADNNCCVTRSDQTVLYVGRIERRKGILTLLQAAAQTKRAFPESHFVFAGDFHPSLPEAEFKSLVHLHGLDSQVELLGLVGWNALADWYRRSAISVLPSHYETFGVAALEPMMFGTPVIATSGGALSEVVEADVSGKLVAAGDAPALARALNDLLTDPDARAQMGQAAITRAATFSIDRVLPLNGRVYEWCREQPLTATDSHLFLSPHLDDAALSCGGLIHLLTSQNKSVHVITVFANEPNAKLSTFAQHLHAKWGAVKDLFAERRREDVTALHELGVKNIEQWDFAEAPYRRTADGNYSYGTYEDLRGEFAAADHEIRQRIAEKIRARLKELPQTTILYFPLSLGRHVDHQIVFAIGLELSAEGQRVRFYEDYPYATAYDPDSRELNWLSTTVPIDLQAKLRSVSAYTTQMRGLGRSIRNLEKQQRAFGSTRGAPGVNERYWEFLAPDAGAPRGNRDRICPLVVSAPQPRLRDLKKLLSTFRWHDLEEVLPIGQGNCLDLGCGSGRHRDLIESRGFRWFGFDRDAAKKVTVRSDGEAIPLGSGSVAAVVAWQMFEYLEHPEGAIGEVARVLAPGGVFCGSMSFLEPVHGQTYFSLSPLILEKLLQRHGFGDIQIKPGLNGFALLLWTLLRRSAIPFADRLALPLSFALLMPLATLVFVVSWLLLRLGLGGGHTIEWLSQKAPLEFAGHIMFSARKKAHA
jgi:glycosyltransferase involved in cell wall biosynthesis/LmbE family N-acetylglucosaminyl deacetylase/SAM-dependent methyltransferase